MDVKTAPDLETVQPEQSPERLPSSATRWTLLLFAFLWVSLYALFHALPYVKNGSDVVFDAKLRLEQQAAIFPADPSVTRVLIFGNSKILAGFLPARFDQFNLENHHSVVSFNSGFPGSNLLLPPLEALYAREQGPNLLLLTLPWNYDPPKRSVFHFLLDDHATIQELFPFRNFVRDFSAFLLNATSHGGVSSYYGQARQAEQAMTGARGYYLITEQSRFPGGRLPDDFHLASDTPGNFAQRTAPATGGQTAGELRRLLEKHHTACYYVPFYLREGEAAPRPPYNQEFAAPAAQDTGCVVIGPDYFLYPNRLFADQTHLNEDGARIYTQDLYRLLKENVHALQ